ncbi:MAG: four helix bundle protein [Caldilineaceae bacterium]|nr:four helix bundle protein [Caldilineaceae bacterium]
MGTGLEDLRIFQLAEELGAVVWGATKRWGRFERNTVGEQLVRAADSIGANIAESYGRYHYGEKLRFLYYARGSLFESRFWLRQSFRRDLLQEEEITAIIDILEPLAIGINNFARSIRNQQSAPKDSSSDVMIKEESQAYGNVPISKSHNLPISSDKELFSKEEISWLININAS